jgi:holliday junction DNA helicase RuvA
MIDQLRGKIKNISEKSVVIEVNGISFLCNCPKTDSFEVDKVIELITYLHWNQEKGPSIYGFKVEFDRRCFLLLLDCPKIGPSIALTMLKELGATQIVQAIATENKSILSSISGIGEKKAEQIIVQLKHKIKKLISIENFNIEEVEQPLIIWQDVEGALISLGYSKQEILPTLKHLSSKFKKETPRLDQVIRSALAFLSQKNI